MRRQTPSSGSLSLRLRDSCHLTLHVTATRRFIMQKARRHIIQDAPTACRRTVSGTLSLPCKGYFSPFPHGTGSLSVTREYLALGDGPPGFRRNFSCSAVLRILVELIWISHTGLLPYVAQLSSWLLLSIAVSCPSPTTPKSKLFGLGFSRFARRY